MTRNEGIDAARKLLGAKAYWRENDKGPRNQDQLDARKAEWHRAISDAETADKARDARRAELLAGDAEYQRLKAAANEAKERRQRYAESLAPRIEIGTCDDIGGLAIAHMKASGMNWADAIRNLRAKLNK